jgi:DNA polymerase I-like protein with 3'-5' exonuclease and polymerase domains
LFSVPESEVTKDQRYLGKQTRHAGNYMEGPETMKMAVNQKAHITGVSVTYGECEKFINLYRSMHHFLVPWWTETERQLWRNRTLYNLLGRRRIFYDHIKGSVPKAVAFVPQSTVGDCLNCGVLAVHGKVVDYMRPHLTISEQEIKDLSATLRNDWGFQMLNQVHDAIGFQFKPEYRFQVAAALRKLMAFNLRNPKTLEDFVIPVEVAYGPNWGDVKEYSEDLTIAA